MRERLRALTCCVLVPAAVACWAPPDDPRFITDSQGRALILHGLNVSNSAKYDPGRVPWVAQADVERMSRDWGFNFARYLISWDGLEPTQGVIDEAYLGRIATRLDWFAAAGIFVVIDMHQDLYGAVDSDGRWIGGNGHPAWSFHTAGLRFRWNPLGWALGYLEPAVTHAFDEFWDHDGHPELQDHYCGAWSAVAARFRDHPAVLGYDLMNEPYAGSLLGGAVVGDLERFDAGPYKAFLERCIAAIRAVDAERWIFFEPRAWGPAPGYPSKIGRIDDPRDGDDRLAYFPHYYSVWTQATSSYDPATDPSLGLWAENRKREIDEQRAPLLLGEWGGPTSVQNWQRYFSDVARMADRMTSGWAFYEYGRGSWGPIDENGDEKDPANLLVRAYPQRIAGRPRLVDYDPETRVLRLAFDEKPGVVGPTEIYVPARRHFPAGFDVWVSDPDGTWSSHWDATREVLSLWTDRASPHHEVAITPRG